MDTIVTKNSSYLLNFAKEFIYLTHFKSPIPDKESVYLKFAVLTAVILISHILPIRLSDQSKALVILQVDYLARDTDRLVSEGVRLYTVSQLSQGDETTRI